MRAASRPSRLAMAPESRWASAKPCPPSTGTLSVTLRRPGKTSLIAKSTTRSEEHTSELQSRGHLVCRLLLEKKKKQKTQLRVAPAKEHRMLTTDREPRA